MLGFSVYLSEDIEKQTDYIKKMQEHGFTSIFTSLQIPEDDPSLYKNRLKKLGEFASGLGMEVMADISPDSLHALGYGWDTAEELLQWGIAGLRIDHGVKEQVIADLSHQMKIALNASTISFDALQRMKRNGLKVSAVEAWHNFYPRPETGLGIEDFITQNKRLAAAGLTVMAFIPGDEELRGPLHRGLPTLEKHRTEPPFNAYMELKELFVDKTVVGDSRISDKTLQLFQREREGVISLRARRDEAASQSVADRVAAIHTNRPDAARDCIRSVESRQFGTIGESHLEPRNCVPRPAGSITIDNVHYLRYQGEVQVTVNDLPEDEKVNVIGRVVEEDRPLLKHIRGNQKFTIEWV